MTITFSYELNHIFKISNCYINMNEPVFNDILFEAIPFS